MKKKPQKTKQTKKKNQKQQQKKKPILHSQLNSGLPNQQLYSRVRFRKGARVFQLKDQNHIK